MGVGPKVTFKVAGEVLPHFRCSVKNVTFKLPKEVVEIELEVVGPESKAFSRAASAVVVTTFVRIGEDFVSWNITL